MLFITSLFFFFFSFIYLVLITFLIIILGIWLSFHIFVFFWFLYALILILLCGSRMSTCFHVISVFFCMYLVFWIYARLEVSPRNRKTLDSCNYLTKKKLITSCWSFYGLINIKFRDKDNMQRIFWFFFLCHIIL